MKAFKRAVTDSDKAVRFDTVNKPGISNLMQILHTKPLNMVDLPLISTN